MSVVYEVYKYLKAIKNKEVSFSSLINKGFNDISVNEAFVLRDSLKSIVNKYYFLVWEANRILSIQDEEIKDYFICALGQFHYVKDFTEERLLNCFNEDKEFFSSEFSSHSMIKAIEDLGRSPLQISEKENEIITKRLSINYAYPEWIVKMMIKHFGIKHTYKLVAASRKNINLTVNTNKFLTTTEQILEKSNHFERGVLSNNTLRYISKEKIIDLIEFKTNKIFVQDETSQMLVDKLNLEPGDKALLIANEKGPIAIDMAMRMKDVGNLFVAYESLANVNSLRAMMNRFRLHSIEVFETNLDLLITYVERQSLDKVLLIPNSSSLGLIRRNPAKLLTLKREDLDLIIENEKKALLEASKYLKVGGRLVYAVYTYNKKESTLIIEEFLKENPDFILVEDKQIFAYEAPSDGVYYAVIERQ